MARLIPVFFAGFLFGACAWLAAGPKAPPRGQELFERRCGGCHALDSDKEGPRLRGVFGRTAGTVDSFTYSEALRKSGVSWNEETLDRWLTNTDQVVAGNDMAFRVPKSEERAEIIAYLRQVSGH